MRTTQIINDISFCRLQSEEFICEYYENIGVSNFFLILQKNEYKSYLLPIQQFGYHPLHPICVYNDDILMCDAIENQEFIEQLNYKIKKITKRECIIEINNHEYEFLINSSSYLQIGDRVIVNDARNNINSEGIILRVFDSYNELVINHFCVMYEVLLNNESKIKCYYFCCQKLPISNKN